jgi:hypothetical protein
MHSFSRGACDGHVAGALNDRIACAFDDRIACARGSRVSSTGCGRVLSIPQEEATRPSLVSDTCDVTRLDRSMFLEEVTWTVERAPSIGAGYLPPLQRARYVGVHQGRCRCADDML